MTRTSYALLFALATAATASCSRDGYTPPAVVAGAAVGSVLEVSGTVTATRAGVTRPLSVGDDISGDDELVTGADGRVTVVLRHNGVQWQLPPGRRAVVATSTAWAQAPGGGVSAGVETSVAAGRHSGEREAALSGVSAIAPAATLSGSESESAAATIDRAATPGVDGIGGLVGNATGGGGEGRPSASEPSKNERPRDEAKPAGPTTPTTPTAQPSPKMKDLSPPPPPPPPPPADPGPAPTDYEFGDDSLPTDAPPEPETKPDRKGDGTAQPPKVEVISAGGLDEVPLRAALERLALQLTQCKLVGTTTLTLTVEPTGRVDKATVTSGVDAACASRYVTASRMPSSERGATVRARLSPR
ncbi:MAG: hypothetical protein R2939_19485 [Kofleriaceae bacterium]